MRLAFVSMSSAAVTVGASLFNVSAPLTAGVPSTEGTFMTIPREAMAELSSQLAQPVVIRKVGLLGRPYTF
jgi:hypothetical protein